MFLAKYCRVVTASVRKSKLQLSVACFLGVGNKTKDEKRQLSTNAIRSVCRIFVKTCIHIGDELSKRIAIEMNSSPVWTGLYTLERKTCLSLVWGNAASLVNFIRFDVGGQLINHEGGKGGVQRHQSLVRAESLDPGAPGQENQRRNCS